MDYTLILKLKYPNTEWTLNGDEYEGLTWLSDSPKPTKAELEAYWPDIALQLKEEEDAKAANKEALLERLGITAEEAKLLLA